MASGRPLLSQASQLRELVMPPSQLLAKVALNAANVAGSVTFRFFREPVDACSCFAPATNSLTVASQSAANALLASPLPWRRQGIKYSSNEICELFGGLPAVAQEVLLTAASMPVPAQTSISWRIWTLFWTSQVEFSLPASRARLRVDLGSRGCLT